MHVLWRGPLSGDKEGREAGVSPAKRGQSQSWVLLMPTQKVPEQQAPGGETPGRTWGSQGQHGLGGGSTWVDMRGGVNALPSDTCTAYSVPPRKGETPSETCVSFSLMSILEETSDVRRGRRGR